MHPVVGDALARHQAAEAAWRARPDGVRFHHLLDTLHALCTSVIGSGRRSAQLLPSRKEGATAATIGMWLDVKPGGGGDVVVGRTRLSVREMINTYIVSLADRYVRTPTFAVTSASYVRQGLLLQAYTLARRATRHSGTISVDELTTEPARQTPDPADAAAVVGWRRALWLHERGTTRPVHAWTMVDGLSLRHCYAALRAQSGAALLDVATELDVHAAALSRARRELNDFLPNLPRGGWIPLGEFAALQVAPQVRAELGLNGTHRVDSRRQLGGDDRGRVRVGKLALWAAYLHARTVLMRGRPEAGPTWVSAAREELGEDPAVQIQMESCRLPVGSLAVLLTAVRRDVA